MDKDLSSIQEARDLAEQAHTAWQNVYLRWSTRHNAWSATRVLADSEATRRDLVNYYHTPPDRIAVVYPGADPDLRRAGDAAIAAALARHDLTPPYFLYLGTLQPRKNLVRLVAAFAASGLPAAGHTLVLAGRAGWLAEPLLAAVAALPADVRARVVLPGYIDETEKAALLSGATALVFPSLYEGFGFPVLEAQACGTPVVCSDTSSLPEVAGEGALLVDPLDTAALAAALRRVAGEEDLRRALIRAGYVNCARFTWATAAAQTMAILVHAAGEDS